MKLGYCPEGNGTSIEPFDEVFAESQDISKHGFDGVDAVVFWGGSDIHPSLYKQQRSKYSQASGAPSARDLFEWKAMLYCKTHNIPMIGVCRGAQLMCAFVGGTLVQHTTGHGYGNHLMTTNTGEQFLVTSCHHQMLYPWKVQHEILGWSSKNLSNTYKDGMDFEIDMKDLPEPEVVYFPQVKGIGIQGHPEWAKRNDRFAKYCNEIIREKLFQLVDV